MFCEQDQYTLEEVTFELGGHEAPGMTWLAGHQLLSEVSSANSLQTHSLMVQNTALSLLVNVECAKSCFPVLHK